MRRPVAQRPPPSVPSTLTWSTVISTLTNPSPPSHGRYWSKLAVWSNGTARGCNWPRKAVWHLANHLPRSSATCGSDGHRRPHRCRPPAIVRRLLVATPGVDLVSMAVGEGIWRPDADGYVECSQKQRVCAQRSLGVGGEQPESAANKSTRRLCEPEQQPWVGRSIPGDVRVRHDAPLQT